jgi:small redox-active disulfide protein 2
MKKIKILGPGCPKCKKLADNTKTAAQQLKLDFEIEKVTDINDIIGFGVMSTPALVVDGQIIVTGKVPSVDEIKQFLAL